MGWMFRGIGRQYFAAISASFCVLTSGSVYGWISPMLNNLLDPDSELHVTPEQMPWIIAITELGGIFAPVPAGLLVDYIGRKIVILASGPFYILSWLIILWFPSNISLQVARGLQGLVMAFTFTVVPVYLGEIASDSVRGAITSIFYSFWWLGYLVEYAIGPFLSFQNFTYFTLALNIPFILFFIWQPESPYYLLMVDRDQEAREALQVLRDFSSKELEVELMKMKENTLSSINVRGVADVIAKPEDKKGLELLLVLTLVKSLSGVGVISSYASHIIDLTPNTQVTTSVVTITLGVVMVIGGCSSSFTIDTFGRRPILLISGFGSCVCHLCTGTYYLLLQRTSLDLYAYGWIPQFFILIYLALCTGGMYPVCTAYTSELFLTQNRGTASALNTIVLSGATFVALITYQPITYLFGVYVNFYLYSLFTFLGSLYFYFMALETKGKAFYEIRNDLQDLKYNKK